MMQSQVHIDFSDSFQYLFLMKNSKRLLIAFIIGILYAAVVGVLLYFHTIKNGGLFRWSTLLSNAFLFAGVAFLVVFLITLLSRSGVFGHLVYAIRKLRKRSHFAQTYKSYPQYLEEHKTSKYNLNIYWIPAAVFVVIAVIIALIP